MKTVFSHMLHVALFIPILCFAQVTDIDSLKISNNSNISVSFSGDNNECIGQVGPHMISNVLQQDFHKLCKGKNCYVKIYPNYSCTGSNEYGFDFNISYGVGILASNYPQYIKVEGFQNNIFIINKT